MSYKDSRCDYIESTSLWRIYVSSERSWNRAADELTKIIKPEKESFYEPRNCRGNNGYQASLVSWQLTKGENQLSSSYPDW